MKSNAFMYELKFVADNLSIYSFCWMNLSAEFKLISSYALQTLFSIIFKIHNRKSERKAHFTINKLYIEQWIICCMSKLLRTGVPTHWR